ncbi:MAG: biotin/lipoyl-binding protein, partial [Verrucomicrobia bacterium]|nr:biotin/lipoyl-binding protein [Verrucomicrobiota bacterium]
MQKEIRKPSLPKHPAVIWSRIKFRWPFLVWLGAIGLAGFLFLRTGTMGPLTGVVDVVRESVAPVEAGRLVSIEVMPGQEVREGDIVARMDSSILDAELELERLDLENQFSRSVQRIQGDLQDQKIRKAEAAAELQVLDDEMTRLQPLLDKRMVDAQMVARIKARQSALSTAVELYPERIAQ